MYHFSIEFLEKVVAALELGEAGCDCNHTLMAVWACFVVTNHSVSKTSRLGVPLNLPLYPFSHNELEEIRIGFVPTLVSCFGNTAAVNSGPLSERI
jgi:hypothetical protein